MNRLAGARQAEIERVRAMSREKISRVWEARHLDILSGTSVGREGLSDDERSAYDALFNQPRGDASCSISCKSC